MTNGVPLAGVRAPIGTLIWVGALIALAGAVFAGAGVANGTVRRTQAARVSSCTSGVADRPPGLRVKGTRTRTSILERAVELGQQVQNDKRSGQLSMFGQPQDAAASLAPSDHLRILTGAPVARSLGCSNGPADP